jgi:RNA polymerase-binding transcription factor DksA
MVAGKVNPGKSFKEERRMDHHHYLTIEQRESLEKLIRATMGPGPRLETVLKHLHQTDYGVCIECGKDIEFVRLQEDPLQRHCRACGRLPVPR